MEHSYLRITSPDLWSLDSFGEWCMANNNRFAGDKAKIFDCMQKELEEVSNDVLLPEVTRSKAEKLIRNLKDWKNKKTKQGFFNQGRLKRKIEQIESERAFQEAKKALQRKKAEVQIHEMHTQSSVRIYEQQSQTAAIIGQSVTKEIIREVATEEAVEQIIKKRPAPRDEMDDADHAYHDLEKSWEFKQLIPGWLRSIHKYRTNDSALQFQAASNAISWHIIDACDVKLTNIITQQEFLELQNDITSYLPAGWMVLETPAERCLYSISMLNKKELKNVAKTVLYDGIRGAIKEIRKILAIQSKDKNENENPFLDPPSINDATSDDKIIQEGDYNHPDVCYILELLRYTYKMISKKIPQRTNSERDIDMFFKSHMFSCFDDILDTHFGEVVSRASRSRRMEATDASADAEGYHLDWIFTKHDLAKDLTWGQEFSLCERAGSKIENGKKILDNTLKVQKTLRDMHRTLLDTLSEAGGGALPAKIIQAFGKLLLPGFVSSGFFVRVLLNVYLGGGYYGSTKLAEFDIPTLSEELGWVITMARTMLNVKNILRQTIKTFALMKEAAKKRHHSMDDALVPPRVKEQVTPKNLRSKKKQK